MSSLNVRTAILNFLTTEIPGENLIDLTADFEELSKLLSRSGVGQDEDWLGVQFLAYEEIPVDILSTNDTGKYREEGIVVLHVVAVAKIGGHNAILSRAETIRNKLRGQRIGSIIVESVSPPNFGTGVTLSFEGGYTAAVINVDYKFDIIL